MSTVSYDIAGSQIDGARDYQEDAFLITHLGDSEAETSASMCIVADGMGGHAAGNVASNMAVQTFNRHLSKNYPSSELASVLYDAVLQANGSITATVAETAALKGMGCTLVACVIERNQLRWVSVGDSHLYLLRDDTLRKMNADHSYGGFLDRMAAAGTPVEAEAGFSRNMLMSALTGDDIAEIDCPGEPLTLTGGDRVILSSDGLDTLPADDIIAIANQAPTAKNCVDALLQAVTDADAPRQDNTTIIVIDVLERVDAAAPPSSGGIPDFDEDAVTVRAAAAPPPGSPFPVEDEPRRSRALPLVMALLVLAAAAGGGWYWWQGRQVAAPLPRPVLVPEESSTMPAGTDADDAREEGLDDLDGLVDVA
ncbi:MAG: protein phosphatase 2C domain-containing protein, partial [Gammaproteobacteria bacterium]